MAIHKIKFFAGRGSRYLAEKIVASYGTTLGNSEVQQFSDGEFQPCFNESIRGCTVFIIQSTFPPLDNLMELLMMIDAARRASAYKVIAVMPYFGWARQDRKDRPRVPIGAKLVANMLVAAGVDRIMTMDLHADQIQGFFDVPVDALYASGIFVPYIKSLNIEDLSIAAPDMGGAKRANTYAKHLSAPIIISHKERAKANVVGKMTAIGDVKGRNVIIVDDMIDTAGQRVGLNILVRRDEVDRHVDFGVVIRGEQGPEGAVDQAGDEHLAVVGARFALHETAGEAAYGGVLLLVFDLEGHEIGVGFCILCGHDGSEQHRVAHLDDDRAVGLLGQFARLDLDLAAVGQRDDLADCVVQLLFFHKNFKPIMFSNCFSQRK